MSRMTKFLRQKCSVKRASKKDDGTVELDKFGEPVYMPAVLCNCRRERVSEDVQTTNGAIVRSSTRYFLDGTYAVDVEDLIDDKTILTMEEYINSSGTLEGYEIYV